MIYILINHEVIKIAIKEQFKTIKDNWLIAIIVVAVLFFLLNISGFRGFGSFSSSNDQWLGMPMAESGMMKSADYRGGFGGGYYEQDDFAPEIEERKKVKTSNVATEVERGTFHEEASRLKSIITSSDSYLLNENVYKHGTKRKAYFSGSYSIKIDTKKYDAVIAQLKDIGELKSFSENEKDVTGQYTNLQINLEIEKERLERYEEMYAEASKTEDKINLNDRIFNQQRTIKYLEDRIANIDKRVDYSTVSFSMTEKRSDYANVVFVKLSELVKSLVGSFNNLIQLIFVLTPWAIAAALIALLFKVSRKHKKRK